MERVQRVLEVERIVNLVKGFGWDLAETKESDDVLTIVIQKKVTAPAPTAQAPG